MRTDTEKKPKQKFRNRYSRKPIEGREIEPVAITTRDIQMFRILVDIKYAPIDYLYQLLPADFPHKSKKPDPHPSGDYQSFSKHITKLYLNGYIDLPFGQTRTGRADSNYRIISLLEKGLKELERVDGKRMPPLMRVSNFEHKLLEGVFRLSSTIATKEDPNLKLIEWPSIMSAPTFPEATKRAPKPEAIPFVDKNGVSQILIADWKPFIVEAHGGFRFCVLEADCDTESGWSEFHNTIKFKALGYLTALMDQTYHTRFGVSTMFPLFLTITERRAYEIIEIIERVVNEYGFDPDLAENFCVKYTPIFSSIERPLPAGGHVLTTPWKRPFKLPDLNLSKP